MAGVQGQAPEGVDQHNRSLVENWLKDGTPTEEPVTTETPPAEGQPQPQPQPKPEPQAQPAAAAPAAKPAEGEPATPKFVGRVGDKDFEVPEDFQIPVKRGEEITYVPIKDIQKQTMLQRDYSIKTADLAEQRRKLEVNQRETAREKARMEAREKALKEQQQQLAEARNDPEKFEAYQQHLDMYEKNPIYRDMVDKAMQGEVAKAELATLNEEVDSQAAQEAADLAQSWINDLAKDERYAGKVDPVRVGAIFSNALVYQGVPFDRGTVERIYQQEADVIDKALAHSPLRKELDEIKATLAAQAAKNNADVHNANTQHALNRGKAPNVAPTGAAPGGEQTRTGPILPQDKEAAIKAWVKGG